MYRCLLLLAVLTLAACDSNAPTPQPDTPDLLPLDIGNRWITDFTRTDADGVVIEAGVDTLTVVRDTVIAGERWFRIEDTLDQPCAPIGWYTNREDGVWKWRDLEDSEAFLIYLYPAEDGDSFSIPGESNYTVTLADTNRPVETSQGTFSGYLYEWDTDEAWGFLVSEGAGRLDRVMVPGRGFAFVSCSYLTARGENNTLVVHQRFDWELTSFDAAP